MVKRVDITGHRFGRLVAVERLLAGRRGDAMWRCVCDCGREHVAALQMLKQGFTKSCGCLRRESARINGQSENSRRVAAARMRARYGTKDAPPPSALDELERAWRGI